MIAAKQVFTQGRATVTLTAGQSISVQSLSNAQVYQQVGFPNEPSMLQLVAVALGDGGIVGPTEKVLGPFPNGATLELLAGASPMYYSVGLNPRVLANAAAQVQGTPGVLNASGTLTAAMILSGIVTSTTAAAVAATLDTGTIMDTNIDMQINDSFDWTAIATGGNAFTVTASAGHTIVGNAVVAAGSSGRFRTRKTAANTFVTYANAVPIS